MTTNSSATHEKSSLTEANFDGLLLRLDTDRNRAGEKYEQIRWKLIKFFQWSAWAQAEELADETFNRVAESLASDKEVIRDVVAFTWGVAKRIRQEAGRRDLKTIPLPNGPIPGASFELGHDALPKHSVTADDARLKCLRECLRSLTVDDRKLLLSYFCPKGNRIEGRRRLAEELGMTMLNLRVRANRLRLKLEQCVRKCIDARTE